MFDLYPHSSTTLPTYYHSNFHPFYPPSPRFFHQPSYSPHPTPPSFSSPPSIYNFYSKFDDLPYYSSIPLPSFTHSYIDESLIRSSRFYNEPPHNYDEENLYSARGLTHLISGRKEKGGETDRMREGGAKREVWKREGGQAKGREERKSLVVGGIFEELKNTAREVREKVKRREEGRKMEGEDENDVCDEERREELRWEEGRREGGKKDESWEGYHSERLATQKKMERWKMEDEMTQRKFRRKLEY